MISANGFDNVQWFLGIIENENDPTKHGRVQVRVFGIHPTVDSQDFDSDYLPWAPVINSNNGTPIPGEGDWVFGFFIDGRDAQHPFVIGTIPGFNGQLPKGAGGSDSYKKATEVTLASYGDAPLHPAQSGEDLETTQLVLQNACVMNKRGAANDKGESKAPAINEPGVPSATDPHKNAVWRSRNSNSYVQIGEGDEEFMLLSHESGSHILIDGEGNIKIKSFGDTYNLSEGNHFEGGSGSKTISIDGDYAIKCKSATFEVEGDFNHVVKGDYNLNVGGKFGVTVGQGFEVAAQRMSLESVSEHINMKSAEKIKVEAGNIVSMKSGSDMFIASGGALNQLASGNMFTSAAEVNVTGGSIAMDGDEIRLNEGASSEADDAPEAPASPKLSKPVDQSIAVNYNEVETSTGSIGTGDIDDIDEA